MSDPHSFAPPGRRGPETPDPHGLNPLGQKLALGNIRNWVDEGISIQEHANDSALARGCAGRIAAQVWLHVLEALSGETPMRCHCGHSRAAHTYHKTGGIFTGCQVCGCESYMANSYASALTGAPDPSPSSSVSEAGNRGPETPDAPAINGNTSDGYHTFDELYAYRKAYNALLFNEWAAVGKYSVHKSLRHHDGELCFGGGWFIVVAQTPKGQISNHYKIEDWNLFSVPALERGAEWDGHSPAVALERLLVLALISTLDSSSVSEAGSREPQQHPGPKLAHYEARAEWYRTGCPGLGDGVRDQAEAAQDYMRSDLGKDASADILALVSRVRDLERSADAGLRSALQTLQRFDPYLVNDISEDYPMRCWTEMRHGALSVPAREDKWIRASDLDALLKGSAT